MRLADGTLKRIRARHTDQKQAIILRDEKARAAELETKDSSALTLNRMLDEWLKSVKPSIAASSYLDYKDTMRLHIRPHLGGLLAARVTADDIEDALAHLLNRKPAALATAHKTRRLLSQAFIWAARRGRVAGNPVALLEPITRPKPLVAAWSMSEAQAFLEAAEGDPLHALFYTAVATGIRKGELLALLWSDINDGFIKVQRTISKGAKDGVKEGAKTYDGNRSVPYGEDLAEILEIQRRLAAKSAAPEQVFPSTRYGRLSGSHVSKRMRALIEAAKVPPLKFHELRKTTASLWARAGVPPAVIQVLLGHATPDLALRVYTRVYAEDLARAALNLGGSIGGLPSARDHTSRAVN